MPVTLQRSTICAPPDRAPLWPAPGSGRSGWPGRRSWMKIAPTRSSTASSGCSTFASAGLSTSTSSPKVRPIEAARLSSTKRSSVRASAEAAVLAEPGRLPGLGLEPAIKLGRVLGEPRQVLGRAQLPDQPGGMPGRARRQLPALEQHDIRPPEPWSGDRRPSSPTIPPPMITARQWLGRSATLARLPPRRWPGQTFLLSRQRRQVDQTGTALRLLARMDLTTESEPTYPVQMFDIVLRLTSWPTSSR